MDRISPRHADTSHAAADPRGRINGLRRQLVRRALRWTCSLDDAEDLFQEAAYLVLRSWAGNCYPTEQALYCCLAKTMWRLRSRSLRGKTDHLVASADEAIDPAPGPLECLLQRERVWSVWQALHLLPPRTQQLIRGYNEGRTFGELALDQGTNVATIRQRYYRGIREMKRTLTLREE
jgi:RNA polymerase sigma factor (sigma-70 family)